MISLKEFRLNFEDLVEKLKPKGVKYKDLLLIKNLDAECLEILQDINNISFLRNSLIKEDALHNQEQIKKIKIQIAELREQEAMKTEDLNKLLFSIPNYPSNKLSDTQETIYEWGEKTIHDFNSMSHIALGEKHNLFNFPESVSIASTGHVIYLGKGEKLFRALINFTLDENEKKGYRRFWMPIIVNENSLFCTSQISKFTETLFSLNQHKFLSPTGEVQLVNLFRNKLILESDLPIKLTTNTNCFRHESVGSGVESNGVLRLYQFNKTEIVTICKPEDSEQTLEIMSSDAEDILKKLNLPYRKVLLANNDIGFSAHITYDLEVWFPSEQKYREISSISNTLSFQSARGQIRYKKELLDKTEKAKLVHILNGSSLAIDRLFAAIIDNYQTEKGSINIPKPLTKYLDFDLIK